MSKDTFHKLIVALLLVSFLILIPFVCGDVPPPPRPDYLDVQYAKVVSEGGYFWLNITLKTELFSHDYIGIRLTYDLMFRCTNYQEYFHLGNHNQTVSFFFIAPFIFVPILTGYIHIESALNGLATDKSIDTTECPVSVVDLDLFSIAKESLYNASYAELLRKYVILQGNYTNLSTEYRQLQDLNNFLKAQVHGYEEHYPTHPNKLIGAGGSLLPLQTMIWFSIICGLLAIVALFTFTHRKQLKEFLHV